MVNLDKGISEQDVNATRFFRLIRYLGRILDFDIEGYEQFLNFQEQLEIIDPDPVSGMWNVQKIFEKISPSCDDFLLVCKYEGVEKNCSEYFMPRRTAFGYCCIFNYARPSGVTE